MEDKILVTAQFYNDEFASDERQQGMEHLSKYGELVLEKEELMPKTPRALLRPSPALPSTRMPFTKRQPICAS